VHSANDFIRAAYKTPQTFNSFYASTNESRSHLRAAAAAPAVNPDLPVNGKGKYEWKGYLPNRAHPQVINPSTGYIVNWNNKPAKDFPASDSRWNEQSLQRQKLLTDELGRQPKQTLATVLAAANAGATEDVRIVELWPTLKKMLDRGKAPNAATKKVADLLQAWHDAGGSRRDADRDGKIDDPGVPILDAAWKGISDAGLCDRLGTALCKQLERRNGRFDQPPGGQYGGRHQYMEGPARAVGQKVPAPPPAPRGDAREDLPQGASWAPDTAQAPAAQQGPPIRRVARAGQGADHLRPATRDHHAVHEQADRHPSG
jgi:hypothetical protein